MEDSKLNSAFCLKTQKTNSEHQKKHGDKKSHEIMNVSAAETNRVWQVGEVLVAPDFVQIDRTAAPRAQKP